MEYIKLFETTAEYNSYTADTENFILPNVSLCDDAPTTVHYNPFSYDYVEIGGVKWATMNVGASSVTDYGLYFQWGDTKGYTAEQVGSGSGQKYFGWDDYKYGSSSPFNKYDRDGLATLESSDDAVTAAWGGGWRMPTTAEFEALGNAVNAAWTTNYQGSGINGLLCTDKTDSNKVLFFPAAGYFNSGSVDGVGILGSYWSSSLFSNYVNNAHRLFFGSGIRDWDNSYFRYYGFPVRGVLDENL